MLRWLIHLQKPAAATPDGDLFGRLECDLSGVCPANSANERHIVVAIDAASVGGEHPEGLLRLVRSGPRTAELGVSHWHCQDRTGLWNPANDLAVALHDLLARIGDLSAHLR